MTLVNHYTGADRAVVVSDTLTVRRGRPAAFGPKFLPVPHAAMVLTGRGPDDVLWGAFRALQHTPYSGGIEGAQTVLPGILRRADADLRHAYPDVEDLDTEVVAVGYSPRAVSYVAVHFRSVADFEPEPQPPGVYLSPAPPCYRPGMTKTPSRDIWIASAFEQQRLLAKEAVDRGSCCEVGGDLIQAELTRAGMTITKLARFPDYDATLKAMNRMNR